MCPQGAGGRQPRWEKSEWNLARGGKSRRWFSSGSTPSGCPRAWSCCGWRRWGAPAQLAAFPPWPPCQSVSTCLTSSCCEGRCLRLACSVPSNWLASPGGLTRGLPKGLPPQWGSNVHLCWMCCGGSCLRPAELWALWCQFFRINRPFPGELAHGGNIRGSHPCPIVPGATCFPQPPPHRPLQLVRLNIGSAGPWRGPPRGKLHLKKQDLVYETSVVALQGLTKTGLCGWLLPAWPPMSVSANLKWPQNVSQRTNF